jgi:hypothetical protein
MSSPPKPRATRLTLGDATLPAFPQGPRSRKIPQENSTRVPVYPTYPTIPQGNSTSRVPVYPTNPTIQRAARRRPRAGWAGLPLVAQGGVSLGLAPRSQAPAYRPSLVRSLESSIDRSLESVTRKEESEVDRAVGDPRWPISRRRRPSMAYACHGTCGQAQSWLVASTKMLRIR